MRERPGFSLADVDPELNALTADAIDAVKVVRNELGAGLYEKIYERALAAELTTRGHRVRVQVPHAARYRGEDLGLAFRADVLVEDRLLIELKAVDALHLRHAAQTLTYLRISGCPLGLLVNFNAVPLSDGIRRFVNSSSARRHRVLASSRHRVGGEA